MSVRQWCTARVPRGMRSHGSSRRSADGRVVSSRFDGGDGRRASATVSSTTTPSSPVTSRRHRRTRSVYRPPSSRARSAAVRDAASRYNPATAAALNVPHPGSAPGVGIGIHTRDQRPPAPARPLTSPSHRAEPVQVSASICRIALSDIDSRACSRPFDVVFKWAHEGGCPDEDPAEDQIAEQIAEQSRPESAEADAAAVRGAARRLDVWSARPPAPPSSPPPAPPYLVGVQATITVIEGGATALDITDALNNADAYVLRSPRDCHEIAPRSSRDCTPSSRAELGAARAVAWRRMSRSRRQSPSTTSSRPRRPRRRRPARRHRRRCRHRRRSVPSQRPKGRVTPTNGVTSWAYRSPRRVRRPRVRQDRAAATVGTRSR